MCAKSNLEQTCGWRWDPGAARSGAAAADGAWPGRAAIRAGTGAPATTAPPPDRPPARWPRSPRTADSNLW